MNSVATSAIRPTATSGPVTAKVRNLLALMIASTAAALRKHRPTNISQPALPAADGATRRTTR